MAKLGLEIPRSRWRRQALDARCAATSLALQLEQALQLVVDRAREAASAQSEFGGRCRMTFRFVTLGTEGAASGSAIPSAEPNLWPQPPDPVVCSEEPRS